MGAQTWTSPLKSRTNAYLNHGHAQTHLVSPERIVPEQAEACRCRKAAPCGSLERSNDRTNEINERTNERNKSMKIIERYEIVEWTKEGTQQLKIIERANEAHQSMIIIERTQSLNERVKEINKMVIIQGTKS